MRIRLRTALLAIALVSLPLACVSTVVPYGGLRPFLRHHDRLATDYSYDAARCRYAVTNYQRHAAPGHSCPICRPYDRPIAALIAEAREQQRAYEREARWHRFLAGPEWLRGGRRGYVRL